MNRDIVMTGDRPTGGMHIGHYFGSLKTRFAMQDDFRCFFMIADYQALTTHAERSREIETHVTSMVYDYLAAGFDPNRGVCFLQSQVPQLAELTMIFSNLVSLQRLLRNPTVKQEMAEQNGSSPASFAFVGYPVSQAADILMFRPKFVPVGPDQRPHIELAREVAHRFNGLFGELFPIPEGTFGTTIGGVDGRGKMGTSTGNAIGLADEDETVRRKVGGMVTDTARVRRDDPGNPDVCPVFGMHQGLGSAGLDTISTGCRSAAIGCTECKAMLGDTVRDLLGPMRERRATFEGRKGLVRDILNLGGSEARIEAQKTLEAVKSAMGLDYGRIFA